METDHFFAAFNKSDPKSDTNTLIFKPVSNSFIKILSIHDETLSLLLHSAKKAYPTGCIQFMKIPLTITTKAYFAGVGDCTPSTS